MLKDFVVIVCASKTIKVDKRKKEMIRPQIFVKRLDNYLPKSSGRR